MIACTSPVIATSRALGQESGPLTAFVTAGGSLYRVEAETLEPDDDLLSLPGLSFQAPRARVLVVYDAHVAYHPRFGRVLEKVLADHEAAKTKRLD